MTRIHTDVLATFGRVQLLRFIRHFLGMVVAMAAGMMVLEPVRTLIVAQLPAMVIAMLYRRSEYT